MTVRCKECKRHRCSRCRWSGRRKTGVVLGCPRCGHATTTHAVTHRSGVQCSLGDGAVGKHSQHECRWCHRARRDDKMRRWDKQWECRDVHGCSRVSRQKRTEMRNG